VIELQNRTDAPGTWLARTRKARLRDSERARAAAADRVRTELGDSEPGDTGPGADTAPAPALRAVTGEGSSAASAGREREAGESEEKSVRLSSPMTSTLIAGEAGAAGGRAGAAELR
jgi:hypothetical protein